MALLQTEGVVVARLVDLVNPDDKRRDPRARVGPRIVSFQAERPPTSVKLFSVHEEAVQQILLLHQQAISRIRTIFQKISQRDENWELASCEQIVSELNKALQENRRFLLFAGGMISNGYDVVAHHDDMLAYHAINCAVGMLDVVRTAGESEESVKLAGLAGLVQNFGMSLIPPDIISKPGQLTDAERDKMREHPVLGAQLPQIAAHPALAEIVAQSHERCDGSGYPGGLKPDKLHPLVLFLHAVDVFEAVTHPRAYRGPEDGHNAMKIINLARTHSLAPSVVRFLIESYTVYPIGTFVVLNTQECAKVVDTNRENVLRPIVAALMDPSGKPYKEFRGVDLSREPNLYILNVTKKPDLEALGAEVC